MGGGEPEARQRFDALFASYSSDIVAYCVGRRATRRMRRLKCS
jgi:hypothetical protein